MVLQKNIKYDKQTWYYHKIINVKSNHYYSYMQMFFIPRRLQVSGERVRIPGSASLPSLDQKIFPIAWSSFYNG